MHTSHNSKDTVNEIKINHTIQHPGKHYKNFGRMLTYTSVCRL